MSNETETMKKKTKRTLTPKLRFPEFRDSEGWQTPQLSDLYGFKRTNTLSRDKLNYEAGTIRNIHYGDIHTKFKPLFRVDQEYVPFINPEVSVDAFREEDDCEEGDIVLADASEDLNDVGKAIEIISLDGQRVVAGTHTILATRHGNVPIVGFGGHLFQSAAVRAGIQRESQGAKVYGISANRISPVALPLPPTNQEQQKIAECLSSLDGVIAAEGRKLAALRDHKRGLMQQLFPQPGQTQPRLRFPEFRHKGGWEVRELSDFITERNQYPTEKVPLFSLTIEDGVTPKTERYERSFLVSNETDAYKLVLPNDFAFNPMNLRFGAIGRYAGTEKVAVSKYYNIFSCDRTVDSKFCEIYFRSDRMVAFYDDQAIGSLIEKRRVHFAAFLKFNIRFPLLPEQQRIADCLTALDTQLEAQAAKIDALKTHKRGLMHQLFPAPEVQ